MRDTGGRLVEQEKARRRCQRPRDLQKLAFAEAQACGRLVSALGQTEFCQQFQRTVADRAFFRQRVRRAQDGLHGAALRSRVAADHDVFQNRHILEDLKILERAAEPAPGALEGRQTVDGYAGQYDLARGRSDHAADHVEQRGLACAVRPDDGLDLPLAHREIEIGDGLQSAKATRKAAHIEERRCPLAHGRYLCHRRAILSPAPASPPGKNNSTAIIPAPKIKSCASWNVRSSSGAPV